MTSMMIKEETNAPALSNPVVADADWVGRQEICQLMGVSRRHLRRLVKQGRVEQRAIEGQICYRQIAKGAEEVHSLALVSEPQTDDFFVEVSDSIDELELFLESQTPESLAQAAEERQELSDSLHTATTQRDLAVRDRDNALQAQAEALLRQEEAIAKLRHAMLARDKAIEANRALLNEHRVVARQRDEAMERLEQIGVQRDEAIKHLARAVGQRDDAMAKHERASEQRDKTLDQLDKAIAQRDVVLDKLDRALEERAMAVGHYEYARQLLMEWSTWRESAQDVLDKSEDRAEACRKLAQEALDTPWWAFKRRREIREALAALQTPARA